MLSFRCGSCNFNTVDDDELVKHFQQDHERSVKADPEFDSESITGDNEKKEIKRIPLKSESNQNLTFECSVCYKKFPSKYYLRCRQFLPSVNIHLFQI